MCVSTGYDPRAPRLLADLWENDSAQYAATSAVRHTAVTSFTSGNQLHPIHIVSKTWSYKLPFLNMVVYEDAQLAILGVFDGDHGSVLEVEALSRFTAELANVLPFCLACKVNLSHVPTRSRLLTLYHTWFG